MTNLKAIKKNATSQIAIIVGGQRSPITNPESGRSILSLQSDSDRIEQAAQSGELKLVRNLNQHTAMYQITDNKVFKSVKL